LSLPEAQAAGSDGAWMVERAARIARCAIGRSVKELDASPFGVGSIRTKGGGQRPPAGKGQTPAADLASPLESATLADIDAAPCPIPPVFRAKKKPPGLSDGLL
jgi:hypothetical protein